MKILHCVSCGDIRRVMDTPTWTRCYCGQTRAVINPSTGIATVSPGAIVIAVKDSEFRKAVNNQPDEGPGLIFPTFVLPRNCKAVVTQ